MKRPSRRSSALHPLALGALALLACFAPLAATSGESAPQSKKPTILVRWGDK